MLPFTLSFLDDVVPDNYRLPVTASVSGGNMTAPNIYRPLYKDWEIQKFVNSNRLDAFGKDGAEVVVTPQEEGGNPYLDDLTYVDFAFIVNKYTNDQCSLADLRDARSVTLTDTLPTYTDRNGVSRIAVFDAEKNPGWTLSEDGKLLDRRQLPSASALSGLDAGSQEVLFCDSGHGGLIVSGSVGTKNTPFYAQVDDRGDVVFHLDMRETVTSLYATRDG